MMKNILLAAIIVILSSSLAIAGENVSSTIKEVTIYSSGAVVKREGTTKIGQGRHDLLVDVDVFALDKDSITAKVFGEGEVLGVQLNEINVPELPQEPVKALESKLKKLKESKRLLTDEKDVLAKKEAFLTSIGRCPQGQAWSDGKTILPKVHELEQLLTFLTVSFKGINDRKQPLDVKIEDLDKEIGAVERELASLRGSRQKTKKVIEIAFSSRKEQAVRIETAYLVPHASWHPVYNVSVPSDLKQADLVMFSSIKQKSGEDWKNVSLSISNVVPLKGASLPDPGSWFLDISRPRPMMRKAGSMPATAGVSAPITAEARQDLAREREAELAFAEKTETPLSFEYRLPMQVTVESRDKETMVPLFSRKLDGQFSYYAVPKANPLTFLVCRASADKELLSGFMNAYFAGRFVGKTFIAEKKAGEDFQVNLGADREVKVARETLRDKLKETSWGFERNTVVRDMAYKITAENLKDRPVTIRIIDTIPVSKTDRIEVKDLKVTPEASEKAYQGRQGVYVWDLEIEPGARKQINIEFTVTYPRDELVIGL